MISARKYKKLLSNIENIVKRLETLKDDRINKSNIRDLIDLVQKLNDVHIFIGLPSKLGMNEDELREFLNDSETVETKMARLIAERARTYIKDDYPTTDQDVLDARGWGAAWKTMSEVLSEDDLDIGKPDALDAPPPVNFAAEQWRIIIPTSDMKKKIAILMDLLESISDQIKKSNSFPENHDLTIIERNTLIVLLETVLVLLRNPVMAERGILKKLEKSLGKVAEKALEKQVEKEVGQGIGELASTAIDYIRDVVGSIFS
ncbi:hypothetical protein mvi_65380 (plasmid) [Methylobacterium indicum]|uniref:Uncharacterized protein n=2 Tax=Methylobacterium indicum TaxID=1775910 RepID=A0A8H8X208_9HYPH|nr:hypothetical protein mvi_65380 [Methylobacterium indicum]